MYSFDSCMKTPAQAELGRGTLAISSSLEVSTRYFNPNALSVTSSGTVEPLVFVTTPNPPL
jgi:hypothetical protein